MVSPSLCVRVGSCEGHHVVYCFYVLLVVLLVPEHGQIRLDVSYYTVDLAFYCSHDLQVFAFLGVLVIIVHTLLLMHILHTAIGGYAGVVGGTSAARILRPL